MATGQNVTLYPEHQEIIDRIKEEHGMRSNAAAIRLALVAWSRMHANGRGELVTLARAYMQGTITASEFAQRASLLVLTQ